jgi:xylose isomerase
MKDYFRFVVAYWHSFFAGMKDQFGSETRIMSWNDSKDPMQRAKDKMDAAFEFITKMGIPYYCFHDLDLIDEVNFFTDYEKRLKLMMDYASRKQKASGVKLL